MLKVDRRYVRGPGRSSERRGQRRRQHALGGLVGGRQGLWLGGRLGCGYGGLVSLGRLLLVAGRDLALLMRRPKRPSAACDFSDIGDFGGFGGFELVPWDDRLVAG